MCLLDAYMPETSQEHSGISGIQAGQGIFPLLNKPVNMPHGVQTMVGQLMNKTPDMPRGAVGRGPGYPSLSLEEAVSRLNQLRDANLARATTNAPSACKVWGWTGESGTARAVLSSLNHYGLMDYVGRGENKQIRLTDLAHRIIFDKIPNSKDLAKALQQAALMPVAHKRLWGKYGADLPPDYVIETYLIRDCKFTDTGCKTLIREYRTTLEFAGLLEPANMPHDNDEEARVDTAKSAVEIGDLVQAEFGGVLAFEKPQRVRAIQQFEGCPFVFVDGQKTGVPMKQVTVEKKGGGVSLSQCPELPEEQATLPVGNRREVFGLDEGDVTLIFPEHLSRESFEDLEGHLQLFLRKARRRAGVAADLASVQASKDSSE